MPLIFTSCIFDLPVFSCLAFSVTPNKDGFIGRTIFIGLAGMK